MAEMKLMDSELGFLGQADIRQQPGYIGDELRSAGRTITNAVMFLPRQTQRGLDAFNRVLDERSAVPGRPGSVYGQQDNLAPVPMLGPDGARVSAGPAERMPMFDAGVPLASEMQARQIQTQTNKGIPRVSNDRNGDGIPDGAEVTKKITGSDGSVTTARWTKGQQPALAPGQMRMMDANGNTITRQGQAPAAGQPDNTQPWTSALSREEVLRREGYNLDAMAEGGAYRPRQVRAIMGGGPLTSRERGDSRSPYNQAQKQQQAERFKMMDAANARELAIIDAQAQVQAARAGVQPQQQDAPKPVMGSAGALIPDGKGGWKTEWAPQEPKEDKPITTPDGKNQWVRDPANPQGGTWQPIQQAPKPRQTYAPLMINGQQVKDYVIPVDETGSAMGEPVYVGQRGQQGLAEYMVPGSDSAEAQPVSTGFDPLEGKTATGRNGEKLIRRNGKWIPLQ